VTSAWIDGVRATAEDLRALALVNYGHFTAMQVRGRAVQGFDLHVERLRSATRELFGADLDEARIRTAVLAALDAESVDDASVRATVYSREYDFLDPARAARVDLLVSVSPPRAAPARPVRLKSYPFARAMPHIKHVGTFPQLRLRALAAREGYDEALFVSATGEISETAIWNIVFRDGAGFVLPSAPALAGTAERLIQAGLQAAGITCVSRPVGLADAMAFRAAYLSNSSGIASVAGIDDHRYAPDPEGLAALERALQGRPWQSLAG
jgi:branched-subunit amino acid aminotransferase/4-amino-4-deoxychorismate lyase